MFTIVCGEDIVASRIYLNSLKNQFLLKGVVVTHLLARDIGNLTLWLADSLSLFAEKRVYFTENLNKAIRNISDNSGKNFLEDIKKIDKMTDTNLIAWESVSSRELKIKKVGVVKEFKPNQSIFKLLDLIFPGKKSRFISSLNDLIEGTEELFIFLMLSRHIRNLILIKENIIPSRMQSWQAYKLKSQAKFWKKENLVSFYESLFRIEIGVKTSSNPFSIKESLEILACHYL